MVTTEIRRAGRDDFPAIAKLIAEQNETPESQCIHSGEGYESILQTMVKWDQVFEICFAIAVRDGHLMGVLGSEFDEDLGRGWLWGPFVVAQDWTGPVTALLQKLLRSLYERAGFCIRYTGLSARKEW